jgi:hypothetical protein
VEEIKTHTGEVVSSFEEIQRYGHITLYKLYSEEGEMDE